MAKHWSSVVKFSPRLVPAKKNKKVISNAGENLLQQCWSQPNTRMANVHRDWRGQFTQYFTLFFLTLNNPILIDTSARGSGRVWGCSQSDEFEGRGRGRTHRQHCLPCWGKSIKKLWTREKCGIHPQIVHGINRDMSSYFVAKHGVVALTRSLGVLCLVYFQP